MLRYLFYILALYLSLPFSATVDITTIIVFCVIVKEDARFALIFAFVTGLLIDLYSPIRLGVTTIVYLTLAEVLLYLRKFLVLNPITTIATFTVLYLIKTAILNFVISAPINPGTMIFTLLAFFPVFFLLNRVSYGTWMKKQ